MRASSTMTREVVVAAPELPLPVAFQQMQALRFRHLPVVAGGPRAEHGRLVGILSDRDVLRVATLENGVLRVPPLTVADVMTREVVCCTRNTTVGWVAERMVTDKIDCVPVVHERGHLVGLITSSDLLLLLVERDQATVLPFDYHLQALSASGELKAVA
jgi:CBS domain-containing protein